MVMKEPYDGRTEIDLVAAASVAGAVEGDPGCPSSIVARWRFWRSARGQSIAQVAQIVGRDSPERLQLDRQLTPKAHDPHALQDEPRPGRPSLWTEDHQALLRWLMEHAPDEFGYFAVDWTVPLLQEQWEHGTGCVFRMRPSAAGCRDWAMSGSGADTSWSPIPSWRKKRRIRARIRHLRPRSVLLVEDETDLLLFPPLRAGWALRGRPREVRISGQNARRVVFGAMNLCTGRRWFLARRHGRGG